MKLKDEYENYSLYMLYEISLRIVYKWRKLVWQ